MEFHSLLSKDGLKCTQCNKEVSVGYRNDGMTQYTQPRLLHDIEEVVLLVTAMYFCEEKHKILGHDKRILLFLSFHCIKPEMCQSLCQTGMNFHSLGRSDRKYAMEKIRRKNTDVQTVS